MYSKTIEFIGGRFYYSVRVDTSEGFNPCSADACAVPAQREGKFEVIDGFEHPVLERYAAFLAANGIEDAGIEFIRDQDGELYAYAGRATAGA